MFFCSTTFEVFGIAFRIMKRSILGLMYLIQGMRHVGIDVDARLADMGILADALDPSSIIADEIEWDILQYIRRTCKIIVPADTAVAPLKKEAFF